MDFSEVIETRRSVRSYAEREIPDDVLRRVLDAARVAPSGLNGQPWRYIVVREQATSRKLAQYAYGQMFVAQAPVVIVCCGETGVGVWQPMDELCYLVDSMISIDHLVLAARNEGLGTCWVGSLEAQPIKKLLSIPEKVEVIMLIPMGYPASETAFHPPDSRKPLGEIAFAEKYGEEL